jgi:hypothetical protein
MAVFVRTQEIEHDIGETGTFALRVTSADVELRGVDGTVARLRASFELHAASEAEADRLLERTMLRSTTGPGSIEVAERRNGANAVAGVAQVFGSAAGVREMRVEADVPRRAHLRFNGVSANLTATGCVGSQRYQTVSGDLVLTEVGDSVRVKSVSGAVTVRASAPIELEATGVSGDISVAAPRIDLLRAGTVSGEIEVDGELAAGALHSVETVSGDLGIGLAGDLAIEVRGLSTDVDIALPHRTEGSRDRRRYVIGKGGPTLIFRSMSGDISVHASRRAPLAAAAARERSAARTDDDLDVLRALERGEIDVDEAARRLGRER